MQDAVAAGTGVVSDPADESGSLVTLEDPAQLAASLGRSLDGTFGSAVAAPSAGAGAGAGAGEDQDEEDADAASTVDGDEAVDAVVELRGTTNKALEVNATDPETSMRREHMTMVLDATADLGGTNAAPRPRPCPLFALVSLNPSTAPSAEVPWSKLLELSGSGERETLVMTVGRDKACDVQVQDPRVSLRHFGVVVRPAEGRLWRRGSTASGQGGGSEDSPPAVAEGANFECFLNDFSSNGSAINSKIVGKGKSARLRSGDEVCVLPEHRVGAEKAIRFLFRNMAELIGQKEEVRSPELDELVQCTICMDTLYKCVALMPCFHNFCSACYSDWMLRKTDCPVCRRVVTAITRNHPMDAIVEAYLQATPGRKRSEAELLEMDERDRLKLKPGGKLIRESCSVGVSTSTAVGDGPHVGREQVRRQHSGNGPAVGDGPHVGREQVRRQHSGNGPAGPHRVGSRESHTVHRGSDVVQRRPPRQSQTSVATAPAAPRGPGSIRSSRSHACTVQ